MPATSKGVLATAAVAISCMAFGTLLGLTGVRKVSPTMESAAEGRAQSLRGADEGEDRRTAPVDAVTPADRRIFDELLVEAAGEAQQSTRDVDSVEDADGETVAGMKWPEQDTETDVFSGPDDEDHDQVQPARHEEAAALVWPEHQSKTRGFWGPDAHEREQLVQLVAKDNWERFITLEDSSLSFSFDFVL